MCLCVCSCPAGEVEAGGVAVELVLAEVDLPQRPPDAPRQVAPADQVILYYIILYYIIVILCYIILCYADEVILYYIMLYYIIVYYSYFILCYIILYCVCHSVRRMRRGRSHLPMKLYYVILYYYTILYYIILYYIVSATASAGCAAL